ncbi:MAG: ribosomal-processing cysteine protease Prp [Lachnospiraceae bacterium]|nr:ribosomal-processing cysteine protease Prp [Lachnospiraceae bacterium]
MTTIIFKRSKTGEYQGFTFQGHAGYAESGNDIVCAALSMLSINTINALDSILHTKMDVTSDEAEGLIDVSFAHPLTEKEQLLVDTLVLGCQETEKQYGKQYCKIKIKEV